MTRSGWLGAQVAIVLFGLRAGAAQQVRSPVVVELFTSEGCSSCPPADALLRSVSGTHLDGRLVVGLGEHVTYWNGLGWTDRFSTERYTDRQSRYGQRFGLDSVYTPQMVVDGQAQFIGSDRQGLERAIVAQRSAPELSFAVRSVSLDAGKLNVEYSVAGTPAMEGAEVMAALTDDQDRTEVARGENGGRTLVHASVVRLLMQVGTVHGATSEAASVPLPKGFVAGSGGHHLVLFVQMPALGPVLGVISQPL